MITPFRQSRLSSVPGELAHLHAELRLVGDAWNSMGAKWQDIAALWLQAETMLYRVCYNTSVTLKHKATDILPKPIP